METEKSASSTWSETTGYLQMSSEIHSFPPELSTHSITRQKPNKRFLRKNLTLFNCNIIKIFQTSALLFQRNSNSRYGIQMPAQIVNKLLIRLLTYSPTFIMFSFKHSLYDTLVCWYYTRQTEHQSSTPLRNHAYNGFLIWLLWCFLSQYVSVILYCAIMSQACEISSSLLVGFETICFVSLNTNSIHVLQQNLNNLNNLNNQFTIL